MGTTSEKLTYLNGTKSLLKDVINYSGANITSETTFRNYAVKLYDAYIDILKGEYSLIEGMPKGQVEGISAVINNAEDLPIYELKMSKESSQHTTTGKNLFDKDSGFRNGYINTSGTFAPANTTASFYQYIPVKPNTTYTVSFNQLIHSLGCPVYYDENKNFISREAAIQFKAERTFTTPNNCYFIVIQFNVSNVLMTQELVDSVDCQVEEGDTPTEYEEYTGGPSPNPDYPQEVKVVEGYQNLFDKDNANIINGWINASNNMRIATGQSDRMFYIPCKYNTTYTVSRKVITSAFRVATYDSTPFPTMTGTNTDYFVSGCIVNNSGTSITITTNDNAKYLIVHYGKINDDTNLQESLNSIMIVEGDQELPYVPYGNNYIAVNISDGTNTNSVPLPLNGNKIAGKENYLDEYIVDKSGHCWLNKLTEKVVLDGTENWELVSSSLNWNAFVLNNIVNTNLLIGLSNYFINFNSSSWRNMDNNKFIVGRNNNQIIIRYDSVSNLNDFKTWLSTHNTIVYYVLAEPQLIDLNATVDLKLFKGVNNITNSEDGNMRIRYVEDISDLLEEE